MEKATLPKSFLKDKFLVPHNFANPEDPDHAYLVHMDLKLILFESTWTKLTFLESRRFSGDSSKDDDYFWLHKIETKDCDLQRKEFSFLDKKIIDRNVDPLVGRAVVLTERKTRLLLARVGRLNTRMGRFSSIRWCTFKAPRIAFSRWSFRSGFGIRSVSG